MTRVASYVFIDLETTSLPSLEYGKTKITELSMVVVKRRHILDTRPGASPRVQDKFTMCFNPRRMVDPGSTDASGLCNYLLEHQTIFNMNVFNAINGFLQCLEKPVCLVAQNGHSFDFPILKNHFEKLEVCLPYDILCADSLHAFFDIFEAKNAINMNKNMSVPIVENKVNCSETNALSGDQIKDTLSTDRTDGEVKTRPDCKPENNQTPNAQEKDMLTTDLMQESDENKDLNSQHLRQQQNEKTPVQLKQKLLRPPNKISKVRRKLFWGNNPKPSKSYKLKDIYERVLGRPAIEAHRAENDCTMAMEISVSIAKEFIEWVDVNCCAFTEVKPMKLCVPLGD